MNAFGRFAAVMTGAAIVVAAGCSHNEPAAAVPGTEPPTGVTNSQNAADQHVVDRLASARCHHEATCNNVGPGRKYVSWESCTDQLRGSTANDLNAYACPRGIDRGALDRCITSIGAEDCGFSLGNLARQNDCRAGALCMK